VCDKKMTDERAEEKKESSEVSSASGSDLDSTSKCRMYEQTYPQKGDLVVAHIDECEEIGARLSLPEYNNAPAMIWWSDATRKRVRSMHKLLRKGHYEVMTVLRTDEAKGYVDLSRRDLSTDEKAAAELRFHNAKIVHSILSHVATTHQLSLLSLYTQIGWPLYRRFGHACDAFALVGADDAEIKNVFEPLQHNLPSAAMSELIKTIRHRMKPTPLKVRAELILTCGTSEGIDAIKEALVSAKSFANDFLTLDVRVISAPLYVITGQCKSFAYKAQALTILGQAVQKVTQTLIAKGGDATVQTAPKVVGQQDDERMQAQLDQASREMALVPDDD
jgi:translation initiation factor 2 subunit 1